MAMKAGAPMEIVQGLPITDELKASILDQVYSFDAQLSSSTEPIGLWRYLDWVTNLPWGFETVDRFDPSQARFVLDEVLFGLEEPKQRVIEHLLAQRLAPEKGRTPLCFMGAPGTGKKTLAGAIARILGRQLIRVSLGGIRDEGEIRGRRRFETPAGPGRVVSALRQVGAKNPVLLLDDIDKLGDPFRGDLVSALVSLLSPEHNLTFTDNYLGVPFDLSRSIIITTADLNGKVPKPLLDYLDVVNFPAYTEDDRVAIGVRHLLPDLLSAYGLAESKLTVSEPAMRDIIRKYTREGGVRSFKRLLARICSRSAMLLTDGCPPPVVVNLENVTQFLGAPRYHEPALIRKPQVGVVTCMMFSEAGGSLMMVEALVLPGRGALLLSGRLGEMIRESAQVSLSCIRAQAASWGIDETTMGRHDLHIHMPEWSVPKDGPSAGVTIAVAMASALTNRPVRGDTAVTGEISLHGRVLPVGGCKEKLLSAYQAGIRNVVIPADNAVDASDLPASVRTGMRIHLVSSVAEVMELVLLQAAT